MKDKLTVLWVVVTLFLLTPIFYYLMYQVLVRVHATELMWFLFWIYVPLGVFISILRSTVEAMK